MLIGISFFWTISFSCLIGIASILCGEPITGAPYASRAAPRNLAITGNDGPQRCSRFGGPRLYVAYIVGGDGATRIATFKASAGPAPQPLCAMTQVHDVIGGLALDSMGRLLVSEQEVPAVSVYPHGADGDALPEQSIEGSNTLLLPVGTLPGKGLATDNQGNIWLPNHISDDPPEGYLTAYAPDANGNVAPVNTIGYADSGQNEDVTIPLDVKLDRNGNMFVADNFHITVFAPPFSDSSKPIAFWSTGDRFTFLSFDGEGNLYAASQNIVAVFKGGLASNGMEWHRLSGPYGIYGIAADTVGHLYLAEADSSIHVLPRHATSLTPIRVIMPPLFKKSVPQSLVIGQ